MTHMHEATDASTETRDRGATWIYQIMYAWTKHSGALIFRRRSCGPFFSVGRPDDDLFPFHMNTRLPSFPLHCDVCTDGPVMFQ